MVEFCDETRFGSLALGCEKMPMKGTCTRPNLGVCLIFADRCSQLH